MREPSPSKKFARALVSAGLGIGLGFGPELAHAGPAETEAAEPASAAEPANAEPATAKAPPPAAEPADARPPTGTRDHVDAGNPRTRLLESAPFDLVGGGGRPGDWAVELSGGWPWQRLRAQMSFAHGLTPLVELETALGRRWRPAVGLGLRWVDRPHVRLSGEVLFAWLFVTPEAVAKRGPQGELRLRLAFPVRRVAPYLTLGSRSTALVDRRRIEGATGIETSRSARHNWTGWATVGLAIAITEQVGVELGVDYPWVDYPTIPIPGFHAGLLLGDFRGGEAR
ncbi:hypothetical protein ENSA5_65280 [Enhygromyxa salina]|uniref:Outer membrane protein beta-barrel domain-containing protein n=1 Tax=Enhygromyxa salina TaxID=215803 RepID=A0A2S9XC55_9BACT|nr:hypothetical protein [Enhygromyxa salina]PRP90436.1 hypothetical protein ENSA5_65280 [Enhygromyxa salina]